MILEAFAGPGGISEALRMVLPDVPALGIEKDPDACATAEAAGHERLQADVSMLDLRPYVGRVVGFCAGPPCQSFSAAGRQLGRLDKPRIVAHIERIRKAGRWLHYSREGWHDPRSPLVLEVLRYALTLRPEWIVLEQVPAVLPLWELVADVLRDHGWHVETGVLRAEQYGVPQTRKRAILTARWCPWHEDGAHPDRLTELPCPIGALLPTPTHRPYRKGVPRDVGDQRLLPWVSMADALGCVDGPVALRQSAMANATVRALGEPAPTITAGHDRAERQWVLRSNYGTSGDPAARGERGLDEPAPTVTSKVNRNQFVRFGNQEHSAIRSTDEPAAMVRFSERVNAVDWVGERPAPTIVGTRRSSDGMLVGRQLADPTDRRDIGGHSGERGIGGSQLAAVRVSVQEAAVLQSYRPDYPWRGSKSAQYRQVGDSAPPVLMAAIIGNLTKR